MKDNLKLEVLRNLKSDAFRKEYTKDAKGDIVFSAYIIIAADPNINTIDLVSYSKLDTTAKYEDLIRVISENNIPRDLLLEVVDKFEIELKSSSTFNIYERMARYFDATSYDLENGNDAKCNLGVMASVILEEVKLITTLDSQGAYYIYLPDEGIWMIDNEKRGVLKTIISEKYLTPKYTTPYILNNVIPIMKTLVKPIDRFPEPDENVIALKNGVYLIKEDKFVENGFKPEYYMTKKSDVVYDPDAQAPAFNNFLEFLFEDSKERDFITEWIGYSMIHGYPEGIQKFLILESPGGYGKSYLINVMQNVIGKNLYSNIKIETILDTKGSGRFALSDLQGKTANFDSDAKVEFLDDGAIIKNLTGGDYISADIKNLARITFKNNAKITASINKLPPMRDAGDALKRRAIVLRLTKAIATDPEALDYIVEYCNYKDMAKETSGIFNMVVEGIKRLRSNKEFSISERMIDDLNNWFGTNNPLELFFKDSNIFLTDEDVQDVFDNPKKYLRPLFEPVHSFNNVQDENLMDIIDDLFPDSLSFDKGSWIAYSTTTKSNLYKLYSDFSKATGVNKMSRANLINSLNDIGYGEEKRYNVRRFDSSKYANSKGRTSIRGITFPGMINPIIYKDTFDKEDKDEMFTSYDRYSELLDKYSDTDIKEAGKYALAIDLFVEKYLSFRTGRSLKLAIKYVESGSIMSFDMAIKKIQMELDRYETDDLDDDYITNRSALIYAFNAMNVSERVSVFTRVTSEGKVLKLKEDYFNTDRYVENLYNKFNNVEDKSNDDILEMEAKLAEERLLKLYTNPFEDCNKLINK